MLTSEAQPLFTLRLTRAQLQRLMNGEAITLTVVLDSSDNSLTDTTDSLYAALRARGLSARQTQLVLLDWQGFTRAEIVERLGLAPSTIDWHWRAINARLGVPNRPALRALVRTIANPASEVPESALNDE
ncbi:MAG TPA: LuxR C-terminal-related transcriptional regulator [Roseiflexaceae bacterium]|nr:LuxR C-terminal-related transcriptional regulator [Roseiflexaceae bacterium]